MTTFWTRHIFVHVQQQQSNPGALINKIIFSFDFVFKKCHKNKLACLKIRLFHDIKKEFLARLESYCSTFWH